MVRLGGKGPVGAYDEAPDGPALRARLEELLAENLSGSAYASSIDTLNNLLPAEYDYAHQADDEDDEDDENDESKSRHGVSLVLLGRNSVVIARVRPILKSQPCSG